MGADESMRMRHLPLGIEPSSAFATPLKGDTLFGQLCWALRDRHGEDYLRERLQGYTEGAPFAVVSDALPERCWPRPAVPPSMLGDIDPTERKAAKKRVWLRHGDFHRPVEEWLHCMTGDPGDEEADSDVPRRATPRPLATHETRFRNSIDRRTGTTTDEGFAPYGVSQLWYREGMRLDCHIVYDAERIDSGTLLQAMIDIGMFGFGRDATVGLGRFTVEEREPDSVSALPLSQDRANAWLTLAPVAPQGTAWDPERCWYQPFTRFGRHGNAAVHLGHPFKTPVLLAYTATVLTPESDYQERLFVGRGLGGVGQPLSRCIPETVHQGYAPVIGIRIPGSVDGKEAAA